MNRKQFATYFRQNASTVCFVFALVLFLSSLLINTNYGSTEYSAVKAGKNVRIRMEKLDGFIEKALESRHDTWLEIPEIPEDMVIYRYICDTLQSWCNQFPIMNDDISRKMVFQKLTNLRTYIVSPLSEIGEDVSYVNLGPKWYLVKSVTDSLNCRIIAGLEVKNSLNDYGLSKSNGVNPKLKIPGTFTVHPVSYSGGDAVYLSGKPVFKLISEYGGNTPIFANSFLRWMALLIVCIAFVLYLGRHKSIRVYFIMLAFLIIATATAVLWGQQLQGTSDFFSPNIYAEGKLFSSFGILITFNITVLLIAISTYTIRRTLLRYLFRKNSRLLYAVYMTTVAILAVICFCYTHNTLKSLIINSNISLELFRWDDVTIYTFIVYLSYTSLLTACLFLIQMLNPVLEKLTGLRFNLFSKSFLLFFALFCSLYFTIVSGVLGFAKEQNRIMVWCNRLAVDRYLALELQLRSVEDAIQDDPIIASLAMSGRNNLIILNRINENYFTRVSQKYDIRVSLVSSSDQQAMNYINNMFIDGTPIAPNSRFIHSYDANHRSRYLGQFIFFDSSSKTFSRMILEIEPRTNKEDKGYYSIFNDYSRPEDVHLPAIYSYSKYISNRLISYKGNYAYPMIMSPTIRAEIVQGNKWFKKNGYIHFISTISNEEYIIISRPVRGPMTYFVTFSYLMLIAYACLYILSGKNASKKIFRKNYFRSRINTTLFISLFLTLVIMATVSVTFVYRRNDANMKSMMSSKINTLQALIATESKYIIDYHSFNSSELIKILESISNTTKSDITLYTPGGKVFRSTAPEVFDRMLIGSRMNEEAFYNIKYRNQRYYMHKEHFRNMKYFTLYAPIFNGSGKMIAILSTPYTDQSYVFKSDAFFHAATIINLFIILLVVTLIISTSVVNAMFRPLIEMGQKMSSADIHGLEYIIYKREDEISTLVDAYNRMVHDLSDSTKKLAQAERDKAWSEMARQVAHEIKNPLTPIKLEIQRLIRLKQRNDPAWEEKFDKVSAIILEHIDILTDTANEFSTFAKLYSEEPVTLDLDKTLKDQLAIFDNKDNIEITYIGMNDAVVLAPKPQLIRVFVNLITNAIQAIEIMQKEQQEDGLEITPGRIIISLRNSNTDGFYDIVFEDNGPGVKDENLEKLFTPNFTTKSGGTGLGLAICRNIIEKCQGDISYRKSYVTRGACFIVRLPKKATGHNPSHPAQ